MFYKITMSFILISPRNQTLSVKYMRKRIKYIGQVISVESTNRVLIISTVRINYSRMAAMVLTSLIYIYQIGTFGFETFNDNLCMFIKFQKELKNYR